jgi:hypothetical protein
MARINRSKDVSWGEAMGEEAGPGQSVTKEAIKAKEDGES